MKNKIKNIIIIGIISIFISQPVFAFVELNIDFPEIAGKTISPMSSLPETLKYVFNIVILIIVLMILMNLIYGGVLYLTSTGDPSKTSNAKKRITGSILGLAIVSGSYLLLKTANPQLLVLKIKKAIYNSKWSVFIK